MNQTMRTTLGWLLPLAAIAIMIGLWQLSTASGFFRPDQFPTATESASAFWTALVSGKMLAALWSTLTAWFWSMLIVTVLAVAIGSALAFSEIAYRSASTVIEVFKAIPSVAILPIVILVLGSTMPMKIFLISFGCFWPLVIQVIYGVRSIDPVVLDTARALGVRGIRKFFHVIVPSASPFIATGLRIASASALILSVVAEIIGGAEGIGRVILQAQSGGVSAYPTMYAYIVLSGLIGLILTGAFFLLERFAMHWHESQRNIRSNEERPAR